MSYDFAIEIDTGGPEPYHIDPYFDDQHPAIGSDGFAGNVLVTSTGYARCGNYTSNVSDMWARCLTAVASEADMDMASGHELHLGDLAGKRCGDIAPLLTRAVEWGVEHLAELHESDPANGWGNADGAVTYLWDIQRMCERHPNGSLWIWR